MKKLEINKIVEKLKEGTKKVKSEKVEVSPKPMHRERDMRQEAMDMGSHGAAEYFGAQD